MNKWKALLTSRKMWASLIGVATAAGLLEFSDAQQADLVQAIVIVLGASGYTFSVAVEDGMTKIAEAQRLTKIQDAIKEYSRQGTRK